MTTKPNPDDWLPIARIVWRSLLNEPALPQDPDAMEAEAIQRLARAFGAWNKLRHTNIMRLMAELLTDVIEHHELTLCEPGQNEACDAIRRILVTFPAGPTSERGE